MRGAPAKPNALVATVAAGGTAAVASVFLAYPPSFDRSILPRAMAMLAITIAAELIAIRLPHGGQSEIITLTEVALVADVVLLPAPMAVGVALGGVITAMALQRRSPVKALFNAGQYALGVILAAALYHGVGRGNFESGRGLASLALGVSGFTAVNLISISAILAATQRRSLGDVIRTEGGASLAIGVGCSSIGIVAVSQYLDRPALVPFVLAPTLAVHLAFRGWVKQKELLQRMEDEKTKLGRVLQHSREGIVLADHDGRVALWSPSMEEITGVQENDAVGKRLAFLLRGRGPQGEAVSIEVSREPGSFEFELMTPSGEARWLHGQHGPGLGDDSTLNFDVIVITDVTRQREVERLKSDFVSTVSHELRTPLTPIKGYASMLLRREDQISQERKREALQFIIDRTDHLARLVEDLLLSASISREGNSNRLPEMQTQQVDVAKLMERVVAPFRIAHPHREILISQNHPITVVADPLRAEQMIGQIVSNALKFSEHGTVVSIVASADSTRAHIEIRDEGRGIPASKLDAIFDKFERLQDPMRMETGGAGLGLFIARQLARAMNGDVTVLSPQGAGSTFTVTIPLAVHEHPDPAGEMLIAQ